MDQKHQDEISMVKEESIKAITDLDQKMKQQDREFQEKITQLTEKLRHTQSTKQQYSKIS